MQYIPKGVCSKQIDFEIKETGEEGVNQMRALLGLSDLVTNVNIPNCGQISNLPMGAVVETNAYFTSDSVTPVVAGEIPESIYPLVSRICAQQEMTDIAISERNVEKLFNVFVNDPLVTCNRDDAKKLFDEMCENTKEYLIFLKFLSQYTRYDHIQIFCTKEPNKSDQI